MVSLGNWISGLLKSPREREIREDIFAAEAWHKINIFPTVVVFMTGLGAVLPAQTVRLESANSSYYTESTAGTAPVKQLIIYGIRSHAVLPDTDMKEGYTFVYLDDEYRCIDIILTAGEVQGIWEATG